MRKLLALAALAAALVVGCGPRAAEHDVSDVAAGDVSNRCANTRFVQGAVTGGICRATTPGPGQHIQPRTASDHDQPASGTTAQAIVITQTSQTSGSVVGALNYQRHQHQQPDERDRRSTSDGANNTNISGLPVNQVTGEQTSAAASRSDLRPLAQHIASNSGGDRSGVVGFAIAT